MKRLAWGLALAVLSFLPTIGPDASAHPAGAFFPRTWGPTTVNFYLTSTVSSQSADFKARVIDGAIAWNVIDASDHLAYAGNVGDFDPFTPCVSPVNGIHIRNLSGRDGQTDWCAAGSSLTRANVTFRNGAPFWTSDAPAESGIDLESISVHEFGHFQGFRDEHWPEDYYTCLRPFLMRETMCASVSANGGRVPGIHDSHAFRSRYPTGSWAGSQWYIKNQLDSTTAPHSWAFASAGDLPLMCDWNGDGVDTAAVFRNTNPPTWYVTDVNNGGVSVRTFVWGVQNAIPICGDWNNDGTDTPGYKVGSNWTLTNSNNGSSQFINFVWGNPDDAPVVGDWNGSTAGGVKDKPGIFRDGIWYFNYGFDGSTEASASFGDSKLGDEPVVGNWDGIGASGIGVIRPYNGAGIEWRLANIIGGGQDVSTFTFGLWGDTPLPGDWDNNNSDSPGLRRGT